MKNHAASHEACTVIDSMRRRGRTGVVEDRRRAHHRAIARLVCVEHHLRLAGHELSCPRLAAEVGPLQPAAARKPHKVLLFLLSSLISQGRSLEINTTWRGACVITRKASLTPVIHIHNVGDNHHLPTGLHRSLILGMIVIVNAQQCGGLESRSLQLIWVSHVSSAEHHVHSKDANASSIMNPWALET